MTYTRDALDRLLTRTESGVARRYTYAGRSDTPAALLDTAGNLIEDYLTRPGGITITIPTSGNATWSYPNLQSHHAITTNTIGTPQTGPATYDPWGTPYGAGGVVDNTATNNEQAAYGKSGKLQERGQRGLVGMGARPLSTTRGRFLSVDPIEGGCANGYVYAFGGPVNQSDLSGRETVTGDCGISYLRIDAIDSGISVSFGFDIYPQQGTVLAVGYTVGLVNLATGEFDGFSGVSVLGGSQFGDHVDKSFANFGSKVGPIPIDGRDDPFYIHGFSAAVVMIAVTTSGICHSTVLTETWIG